MLLQELAERVCQTQPSLSEDVCSNETDKVILIRIRRAYFDRVSWVLTRSGVIIDDAKSSSKIQRLVRRDFVPGLRCMELTLGCWLAVVMISLKTSPD
jgi:hypothetical protein